MSEAFSDMSLFMGQLSQPPFGDLIRFLLDKTKTHLSGWQIDFPDIVREIKPYNLN